MKRTRDAWLSSPKRASAGIATFVRRPPPTSMNNRSASHAATFSADEIREALRPIASLIGKSEKAQRKLAPGTWQHAMLRDNLLALRTSSALMDPEPSGADRFGPDDFKQALPALVSMIGRTENAEVKFAAGTSQHSLLRNRLKALRIAEALVRAAADRQRTPKKGQQ